ncbi:MAG: transporter substrate-binding domain-containing protein, partial [Pseudomonadota bacterium]
MFRRRAIGSLLPKSWKLPVACLLFSLAAICAKADARGESAGAGELRDVRIVYTRLPPYVSGENAEPVGYSIDLLRAIAVREGWRFSYIEAANPSEALEMLRTDEAELHPNLAQNAERDRIVDFSIELGSWDIAAIVDPTRVDVERVNQTAGMRFGYVTGSIARTAASVGPFTAVEVESTDALVVDFLSGELDGVLFVAEAFQGIAFSTGNADRIKALPPILRRFGRHVVISKASGLKPALDAALFAFLETEEHAEIRKRWFGDERFLTPARIVQGALVLLAFLGVLFLLYRRRVGALAKRYQSDRLDLLTELANALPYGVHIVDEEDRLLYANSALRQLDVNWDEAIDRREDNFTFTKRLQRLAFEVEAPVGQDA